MPRPIVELLSRDARSVMDYAGTLAAYASAAGSMDDYAAAEPGSLSMSEKRPADPTVMHPEPASRS